MKSGNLNFLEPSVLLQACNGSVLPFYLLQPKTCPVSQFIYFCKMLYMFQKGLTELNKFWNVASCWLYSANMLTVYTGSGRNTRRFGNTAVSGIIGVGNLSLSALLARLKALQLPWSAGLQSIGLWLWRSISKTTVLSLWLSGYFVGTSILFGTTVSLVAILYCCGWETAEKQRLA